MYQRIMDDVIDSCQVTFEEDGVNQHTLDELRKVGILLGYHIFAGHALLGVGAHHESLSCDPCDPTGIAWHLRLMFFFLGLL